ncbi:MAG: nucleotidyl transferase AbiEii/AbiGii toxin family protein [Candidatus Pacebacteria bacterium]|nr:nucleotidyl transferase AbiEii/AbiGii toxin family protein [Candidatus Paceibacterota bacterium]
MHQEVLNDNQEELISLLGSFSDNFGLIGGTAIALQIGHRSSIDFDLASIDVFDNRKIKNKIENIDNVLVDEKGEYTIITKGTKVTFLHYPFKIEFKEDFNGIKVADLLTLAALKAYALGRRTKWTDYVDLYFIFKDYFNFNQVVEKAESIFGKEFNEKVFRTQLGYFEDIDYSEKIEYMPGFEVEEEIIKKELSKISIK